MRIEKLYLEAYGCHKEKEFVFNEGLNTIVENNEFGKSTIVDSINTLYNGFKPANSENNPYFPWDSNAMRLKGFINIDNKIYTVERNMLSSISGRYSYTDENNENQRKDIKNRRLDFIEVAGKEAGADLLDNNFWLLDHDALSANARLKKCNTWNELVNSVMFSDSNYDFDNAIKEIGININKIYTNTSSSVSKIALLEARARDISEQLEKAHSDERDCEIISAKRNEYIAELENIDKQIEEIKFSINENRILENEAMAFSLLVSDIRAYNNMLEMHSSFESKKREINADEKVQSKVLETHYNLNDQLQRLKADELAFSEQEMSNYMSLARNESIKCEMMANEESRMIDRNNSIAELNKMREDKISYLKYEIDRIALAKKEAHEVKKQEKIYELERCAKNFKIRGIVFGALFILSIAFIAVIRELPFFNYFMIAIPVLFIFHCAYLLKMSFDKSSMAVEEKNAKTEVHIDNVDFSNLDLPNFSYRDYLNGEYNFDVLYRDNSYDVELEVERKKQFFESINKIDEDIANLKNKCNLNSEKMHNLKLEIKSKTEEIANNTSEMQLVFGTSDLDDISKQIDDIKHLNFECLQLSREIKSFIERLLYNVKNSKISAKFKTSDGLDMELDEIISILRADELVSPKQYSDEIATGEQNLEELLEQRQLISKKIGFIESKLSDLDSADSAILKESLEKVKSEIEELKIEHDRLMFVRDVISGTKDFVMQKNQPKFLKYVNDNIYKLTNNSIRAVMTDSNGEFMASLDGNTFDMEFASLSTGTKAQMILLVKLAIMNSLDEEGVVPLVLDGSFVNFDETRKALAFELLREEAKKRQILFFTC